MSDEYDDADEALYTEADVRAAAELARAQASEVYRVALRVGALGGLSADVVLKALEPVAAAVPVAKAFDESKHPRDHGRFAAKDGGSGAGGESGAQNAADAGAKFPSGGELAKAPGRDLKAGGLVRRVSVGGRDYVVKRSANKMEAVASDLAQIAGVRVPRSQLTDDGAGGRVLVQEVAEGQSLDKFADHNAARAALSKVEPAEIDKHVLFDYLLGNTDVHRGNYMVTEDGKLSAIDKEMILGRGNLKGQKFEPSSLLELGGREKEGMLRKFGANTVKAMAAAGYKMAEHLEANNMRAEARQVRDRAVVLDKLAEQPNPTAGALYKLGLDGVTPPNLGALGRLKWHLTKGVASGEDDHSEAESAALPGAVREVLEPGDGLRSDSHGEIADQDGGWYAADEVLPSGERPETVLEVSSGRNRADRVSKAAAVPADDSEGEYTTDEIVAAALELADSDEHPAGALEALAEKLHVGKAWDESKHKRDHGKFSSTGGSGAASDAKTAGGNKPGKRALKAQKRAEAVQAASALMAQRAKGKPLSHGEAKELLDHMAHLTHDDLRALRKEHGSTFRGERVKGSRVDALVKWARGEDYTRRRGKRGSALQQVVDYGGLDPNSADFKRFYGSMRDAVNDGVPMAAFKRGGQGLDELAAEMVAAGHISIPDWEDPAEHLVGLLRGRKLLHHAADEGHEGRYAEHVAGQLEGDDGSATFDPNKEWDDEDPDWFSKAAPLPDDDTHTPAELLAAAVDVAQRALADGTDPEDGLHALYELAHGDTVQKAWDKDKHPRDDHGRFVSKDAIQAAKSDPKKAAELKKRVTNPEQRKKLDAALEDKEVIGTKRGLAKHETAQKREKVQADRNRARELRIKLADQESRGEELNPDDLREIVPHLATMTHEELSRMRSMLERSGATFGGKRLRADRVAALTQWALDKAAGKTDSDAPESAVGAKVAPNSSRPPLPKDPTEVAQWEIALGVMGRVQLNQESQAWWQGLSASDKKRFMRQVGSRGEPGDALPLGVAGDRLRIAYQKELEAGRVTLVNGKPATRDILAGYDQTPYKRQEAKTPEPDEQELYEKELAERRADAAAHNAIHGVPKYGDTVQTHDGRTGILTGQSRSYSPQGRVRVNIDGKDSYHDFDQLKKVADAPAPTVDEYDFANHPEFSRLDRVYGHLSQDEIAAKLNSMGEDVVQHYNAGRRASDGDGGARTSASVSAQASRDVARERMLLRLYGEHKFSNPISEAAGKTDAPAPEVKPEAESVSGAGVPSDEDILHRALSPAGSRIEDTEHPRYQQIVQAAERAQKEVLARMGAVSKRFRELMDPDGSLGIADSGASASYHIAQAVRGARAGNPLGSRGVIGDESGKLLPVARGMNAEKPTGAVSARARKLAAKLGTPIIPLLVKGDNDEPKGWAFVQSPVEFPNGVEFANTIPAGVIDTGDMMFSIAALPKDYRNGMMMPFDSNLDFGTMQLARKYATPEPATGTDAAQGKPVAPDVKPEAASGSGADSGDGSELVLWGIPHGETDPLHAKVLYTQGKTEADLERIKQQAGADGWHSFSVQKIDRKKPLEDMFRAATQPAQKPEEKNPASAQSGTEVASETPQWQMRKKEYKQRGQTPLGSATHKTKEEAEEQVSRMVRTVERSPQALQRAKDAGVNTDEMFEAVKVGNRWGVANTHKMMVATAIAQGRSVPAEVLADYPDLAAKYAKPDAGTSAAPVPAAAQGKPPKTRLQAQAERARAANPPPDPNAEFETPREQYQAFLRYAHPDDPAQKPDPGAVAEYLSKLPPGAREKLDQHFATAGKSLAQVEAFHRARMAEATPEPTPRATSEQPAAVPQVGSTKPWEPGADAKRRKPISLGSIVDLGHDAHIKVHNGTPYLVDGSYAVQPLKPMHPAQVDAFNRRNVLAQRAAGIPVVEQPKKYAPEDWKDFAQIAHDIQTQPGGSRFLASGVMDALKRDGAAGALAEVQQILADRPDIKLRHSAGTFGRRAADASASQSTRETPPPVPVLPSAASATSPALPNASSAGGSPSWMPGAQTARKPKRDEPAPAGALDGAAEQFIRANAQGEYADRIVEAAKRIASMGEEERWQHEEGTNEKVKKQRRNAGVSQENIDQAAHLLLRQHEGNIDAEERRKERAAEVERDRGIRAAVTHRGQGTPEQQRYAEAYHKLKEYLENGGEYKVLNHVRGRWDKYNKNWYKFDDATGEVYIANGPRSQKYSRAHWGAIVDTAQKLGLDLTPGTTAAKPEPVPGGAPKAPDVSALKRNPRADLDHIERLKGQYPEGAIEREWLDVAKGNAAGVATRDNSALAALHGGDKQHGARHYVLERLASAAAQAHKDGDAAGHTATTNAVTGLGGTLHGAAPGETIAHDPAMYDHPEGAFSGDAVKVTRQPVTYRGALVYRGQVEPVGTGAQPPTNGSGTSAATDIDTGTRAANTTPTQAGGASVNATSGGGAEPPKVPPVASGAGDAEKPVDLRNDDEARFQASRVWGDQVRAAADKARAGGAEFSALDSSAGSNLGGTGLSVHDLLSPGRFFAMHVNKHGTAPTAELLDRAVQAAIAKTAEVRAAKEAQKQAQAADDLKANRVRSIPAYRNNLVREHRGRLVKRDGDWHAEFPTAAARSEYLAAARAADAAHQAKRRPAYNQSEAESERELREHSYSPSAEKQQAEAYFGRLKNHFQTAAAVDVVDGLPQQYVGDDTYIPAKPVRGHDGIFEVGDSAGRGTVTYYRRRADGKYERLPPFGG